MKKRKRSKEHRFFCSPGTVDAIAKAIVDNAVRKAQETVEAVGRIEAARAKADAEG